MRVLALVQGQHDRVPSQRYRIEQWEPLLRGHGIEVVYEPLETPQLGDILHHPGRYLSKARLMLAAFCKRLHIVRSAHDYDLIYVLRETALFGPPVIERQLRRCGVPVVFDFDDSVFMRYVSPVNGYMSWLKFGPSKTRAICRLAAHVMAGNPYLAAYARRFNPHVTIVPTTIDTRKYSVVPRTSSDVPVIGWTGSHSTLAHLRTVGPTLQRLARKERFRLRVIGVLPYELPGVDVENVTWQSKTEVSDLRPIDIGIMPLPDDLWSRGKCGLKALAYMALGIPAVCSPVGVNSDIIEDGINGFLASSADEWIAKLTALLHSPELRQRLGRAGRATVEEQYSVSVQAPRVAAIFAEAANSASLTSTSPLVQTAGGKS